METPDFSQKSWIQANPDKPQARSQGFESKAMRLFEATPPQSNREGKFPSGLPLGLPRSHGSAKQFVERSLHSIHKPVTPSGRAGRSKVWWVLGAGWLALTLGCNADPKPRVYSEKAMQENPRASALGGAAAASGANAGPAAGGMGAGNMPPVNTSPVDIKLTWKAPETWMKKDSAGGMRVGSYAIPTPGLEHTGEIDPNAVDLSVVQLAGDAGGLEANITRWMGQVGLISTPQEMTDFVKTAETFKTKSGQKGMYVDLTSKLSGDMTQSKSIFGAVVTTANYTVFVKAMGDRARVVAEIPKLKAFCESLAISGPEA